MITQTYNLDLVPNGITTVVPASQYDNTRTLVFKLYENGVAFDTSGASSAVITGRKPDNCFFMAPMTVGQGEVSVDLATQMTACAGNTTCEIVLYDSEGNQLGSTNFILNVEKAPVDDSSKISQSDISAIVSALSDSQRYANSAKDAAQSASSTAAALESLVPATAGNVGDVLTRSSEGSDWQALTANLVSYDNSTSGLTAVKVQGAIDEVSESVETLRETVGDMSATDVSYDASTSGLEVTNAQEAIDKLADSRNLRVSIKYDSETGKYTSNHTYEEILANLKAGAMPYAIYQNFLFKYADISTVSVMFIYVNEGPFIYSGLFNPWEVATITIRSDGGVLYFNWGDSSLKSDSVNVSNTYWGSGLANTVAKRLELMSPKYITVTVPTSSWSGKKYVYTSNDIPDPLYSHIEIVPRPGYTDSGAEMFAKAALVPYDHKTGSITIYATGTVPTIDFPVELKITRNALTGHQ